MSRRANGEGSVYQRQDGRWAITGYVTTTEGRRRRIQRYAPTKREAQQKLRQLLAQEDAGIPTPDTSWQLGAYLHQWLATTAQIRCRPRTIELYSHVVDRYLIPRLGAVKLDKLGVRTVQAAFDQAASSGVSVRLVAEMKKVLGAALTQAQREELIVRNPARLTRVAPYRPAEVIPWTPQQVGTFLEAALSDRLYPAFVLTVLYGLRRGEVVGLRWQDIDYDRGIIRIRNQLQSIAGTLTIAPVKTKAGERDLPLLPLSEHLLAGLRAAKAAGGFVFCRPDLSPVAPHSLGDAFTRIRRTTDLPKNRFHDLRHTTATMLKTLGVSVRDAQAILGHASPLTTQLIYQHSTGHERRAALQGIELLLGNLNTPRSCHRSCQNKTAAQYATVLQIQHGGPSETRTHDTLLKSRTSNPIPTTLTEVKQLVNRATRIRMLGGAAVIYSCQS